MSYGYIAELDPAVEWGHARYVNRYGAAIVADEPKCIASLSTASFPAFVYIGRVFAALHPVRRRRPRSFQAVLGEGFAFMPRL